MTERPTYWVTARRDEGGWWFARVDGVQGAVTQARRLDQVEAMAREAVSLLLEVSTDSFDLEVVPELPEPLAEALAETQRLRLQAEQVRATATSSSEDVAARLADSGLSVRDIGGLLGVSFQRAQQLVQAGR